MQTANEVTQAVLDLDLNHLTPEQIKYLHDLKAEAFKQSLAAQFAQMKGGK